MSQPTAASFWDPNYIDESLCCIQMDWKPSQRGVRKKKHAVIKISLTQSLGGKMGNWIWNEYMLFKYKFSVSDLKGSVYKPPHPEPTLFSNHSVISKPKWIDYVLCFLCIVGEYVLTKDKGALRH